MSKTKVSALKWAKFWSWAVSIFIMLLTILLVNLAVIRAPVPVRFFAVWAVSIAAWIVLYFIFRHWLYAQLLWRWIPHTQYLAQREPRLYIQYRRNPGGLSFEDWLKEYAPGH
jgi:hypothetical protein